jgi:hypothetical protein
MYARNVMIGLAVVGSLSLGVSKASAGPILQLHLEGGTYDAGSESWVVDASGAPIRLWAIGNVDGEGGKGTIYDVTLSVAYETGSTPTISLRPSTTGGYGGFTDPSAPSAPAYIQTGADGSVPLLGDGSGLPSHGEFGPGISWQAFSLGDFDLTDSPIADFVAPFPAAGEPGEGQINVYEISVSGYDGMLHFDLYGRLQAGAKARYTFAPVSHDGTGCCTTVPEPGSLALLGVALAALAIAAGARCAARI